MKKQVVIIHGGTTFDTNHDYLDFLKNMEVSIEYLQKVSWKDTLQEKLGKNFDVVRLQMPNKIKAKYEEWKIYFDKYAELFNNEVIIVAHSLGATFIIKYLSENNFPKKIKKLYLTSTPINNEKGRGHFGQEEFPEIVEDIKNISA